MYIHRPLGEVIVSCNRCPHICLSNLSLKQTKIILIFTHYMNVMCFEIIYNDSTVSFVRYGI